MAVRLRLRRVGGHKDPVWRVVVADDRAPRDGRVIETIGHYNPQRTPSLVAIDLHRAKLWLSRGAQPTAAVRKLLRISEGVATAPRAQPASRSQQEAGPGQAQAEGGAQSAAAAIGADGERGGEEPQEGGQPDSGDGEEGAAVSAEGEAAAGRAEEL